MKCGNCKKRFDSQTKYFNHRKQNCKIKTCPRCGDSFKHLFNLNYHLKKQKQINCDHCNEKFCNNDHFQKHLRSIRNETDDSIPDLDQQIYPPTGHEDDEGYIDIIEQKGNEINDRRKKTALYEEINKQIDPSYTYRDINDLLLDLYSKRKNAFKINIGFGFVLYNHLTEEYKYYYISNNNLLFEIPVLICNRNDISDLMKHIVSLDLATNFYLQKPSSAWTLAGLTNINVFIFDLKDVPLG
jgi:DNA-directed RNA polymerase subunit RPC12/RpoP